MAGKFVYRLIDYGGERSSVQGYTATLNAGNIAAADTALDTLVSAINGVTLMNPDQETRVYEIIPYAGTLPTDQFAQREQKWLVRMHDSAGNRSTMEIPGADLSQLVANTELMDIGTGTDGETLVNAIEAVVVNSLGNAVVVDEIVYVSRNI